MKEIERKYLVTNDAWRSLACGKLYQQGYLNTDKHRTVRVRIVDNIAFLTIKGLTTGAVRTEYEYEIPVEEARAILSDLCEQPIIEKKRYCIEYKGLIWEVDEFFGENKGLILAEVELTREDQIVEKPGWVGKEVTKDPRYQNASLVNYPYTLWKQIKPID